MRCVDVFCWLLMLPPLSAVAAGIMPADQAATKTFTSATWGLALEYPAGWSVEDDGDEVMFRSEEGRSIVLGRTRDDNASDPAPGRRASKPSCTTTTTAHGVEATVCSDAASNSRRAVVVLKARDGVESRLAIRMQGRDASVFDAILRSVRRYP